MASASRSCWRSATCEDHAACLHVALRIQHALAYRPSYSDWVSRTCGSGHGPLIGPMRICGLSIPRRKRPQRRPLQRAAGMIAVMLPSTRPALFRFTAWASICSPRAQPARTLATVPGHVPPAGAPLRPDNLQADAIGLPENCWTRVCVRRWQVVCLIGEAGIGKSHYLRMSAMLARPLADLQALP